jgi:hypothetical protein
MPERFPAIQSSRRARKRENGKGILGMQGVAKLAAVFGDKIGFQIPWILGIRNELDALF